MKHKLIKLISVITICAFALNSVLSAQCSVVSKLGTEHWELSTAIRPLAEYEKWLPEKRPQGGRMSSILRPPAFGEGRAAGGEEKEEVSDIITPADTEPMRLVEAHCVFAFEQSMKTCAQIRAGRSTVEPVVITDWGVGEDGAPTTYEMAFVFRFFFDMVGLDNVPLQIVGIDNNGRLVDQAEKARNRYVLPRKTDVSFCIRRGFKPERRDIGTVDLAISSNTASPYYSDEIDNIAVKVGRTLHKSGCFIIGGHGGTRYMYRSYSPSGIKMADGYISVDLEENRLVRRVASRIRGLDSINDLYGVWRNMIFAELSTSTHDQRLLPASILRPRAFGEGRDSSTADEDRVSRNRTSAVDNSFGLIHIEPYDSMVIWPTAFPTDLHDMLAPIYRLPLSNVILMNANEDDAIESVKTVFERHFYGLRTTEELDEFNVFPWLRQNAFLVPHAGFFVTAGNWYSSDLCLISGGAIHEIREVPAFPDDAEAHNLIENKFGNASFLYVRMEGDRVVVIRPGRVDPYRWVKKSLRKKPKRFNKESGVIGIWFANAETVIKERRLPVITIVNSRDFAMTFMYPDIEDSVGLFEKELDIIQELAASAEKSGMRFAARIDLHDIKPWNVYHRDLKTLEYPPEARDIGLTMEVKMREKGFLKTALVRDEDRSGIDPTTSEKDGDTLYAFSRVPSKTMMQHIYLTYMRQEGRRLQKAIGILLDDAALLCPDVSAASLNLETIKGLLEAVQIKLKEEYANLEAQRHERADIGDKDFTEKLHNSLRHYFGNSVNFAIQICITALKETPFGESQFHRLKNHIEKARAVINSLINVDMTTLREEGRIFVIVISPVDPGAIQPDSVLEIQGRAERIFQKEI